MNTSYTFKVGNLIHESDGYVHTAYYTYTGVSTTGSSVKSHSLTGICTFSLPDSLVFYFVEIMDHIGFTTVFWTLLGLYVFYQWDNRKKKRK